MVLFGAYSKLLTSWTSSAPSVDCVDLSAISHPHGHAAFLCESRFEARLRPAPSFSLLLERTVLVLASFGTVSI